MPASQRRRGQFGFPCAIIDKCSNKFERRPLFLSVMETFLVLFAMPHPFFAACVHTSPRGLTPHLQLVPAGMKMNPADWLNNCGGLSRAVARPRTRRRRRSSGTQPQARNNTSHATRAAQRSVTFLPLFKASAVSFLQNACSRSLIPLDTWAGASGAELGGLGHNHLTRG